MGIKFTNTPAAGKNRLSFFAMKSILLFFCSLAFGTTTKMSFSQNPEVIIESDLVLSVDEVFDLIKSQTDYRFIYQEALFKDFPKVHLKKGKIKVEKLLKNSLLSKGYNYSIDKNIITIKSNKPTIDKQDTFTITGTVVDEFESPFIGATVYTSTKAYQDSHASSLINGTQTDFDGKFEIKAEEGQYLIVTFIGYKPFSQIIVPDQTIYNVVLIEAQNQLEEVVITGITKTQKIQSAAAANKIDVKAVNRQITVNLDEKLQGLSPGLILNSVTPPGGQERIELQLRGQSTFASSSTDQPISSDIELLNKQPLIVLDGFPYEGPFNDIDPQTIEDIQVLKDAAATAIWGIKASNGVLVITTKRGKTGEVNVSFNTSLSAGSKIDLHKYKAASSNTSLDIFNNSLRLDPFFSNLFTTGVPLNATDPSLASLYRPINAYEKVWVDFNAGLISEAERDRQLEAFRGVDNFSQFEDNFLRGGLIFQNSLNVNGGSGIAKFSLTATHTDEKRPNIGDEFERLNLSLTSDFKLSQKLSAVADVSYATSEQNDNGIGVARTYTSNAAAGDPLLFRFLNLENADGSPATVYNVHPLVRDQFLNRGFESRAYSPITDRNLIDDSAKTTNLRLAAGLTYKPFTWLSANVKYQHNIIETTLRKYLDPRSNIMRFLNNRYITGFDTGAGVARAVPYGGELQVQKTQRTNKNLRGTLEFNETLGAIHSVTVLVGAEFNESADNQLRFRRLGYNDASGTSASLLSLQGTTDNRGNLIGSQLGGTLTFGDAFRPDEIFRTVSSFANTVYSFDNKYNLNASLKLDQASAFGINQRLSKNKLWSVGASWNIDRESFFNVSFIDQLKLRASYGINGNFRRRLFTKTTIGISRNPDFINGGPSANITDPGNKNLTLEKTANTNIGLDFGLFGDRLRGTVDVYNRESDDLIALTNINPTTGFSSLSTNTGVINNKGIEVSLGTELVRASDFSWNINLNYSYNKSRVKKFNLTAPSDIFNYVGFVNDGSFELVGEDISTRVRFPWAGLDNEGNPQVFNRNGDRVGYVDYNTLTTDDLVATKPFVAPHFGGFTNSISYKNFTLSALATYKFGHVFEEDKTSKYAYPIDELKFGFHKDVERAWKNPGDEAFTDIPALPRTVDDFFTPGETNFNRFEIFNNSNFAIHDAAHVRLQDITLAYNFNENVLERLNISALKMQFQVRDLGVIWSANKKNIDPESVPFSNDANLFSAFPRAFRPGVKIPPTYVLSFSVNF
ncbi:SusC/RagA family TonB-linked outer membrane protein [Maribacter sp. 2304DJ31-5]|uniref:SusC/RagA family TonB-linked outer membrane protein n=1 Tax=Maribacter sp. 2304DJ31-5 TaxID=3386273 RepID=UPI0039BD7999